MGTITMSGFNKIDWNAILDAVMTQERLPLTNMTQQRTTLQSKSTAFGTLAGKLSSLESAASDLTDPTTFGGRTASVSDNTAVTATAGSTAMTGAYDIVVTKLARAQVTTLGIDSTDPAAPPPLPDKDQTVVATGGNLTFLDSDGNPIRDGDGNQIGVVALGNGSYTLQQLADAINGTAGVPARATIVQAEGNYRLVLTGTATGEANGFALQDNRTGGLALTSTTAMPATDADITVNNVRVTSSSNVIGDAVAGVSLTLLEETGTTAVSLTVAEDPSVTESKVKSFISAFNTFIDFADAQSTSARNGETGNIGNDPMLRGLRTTLSATLLQSYGVNGAFHNLAEVGIEFERGGKLSLDATVFGDAIKNHRADLERLLGGSDGLPGAFAAIETTVRDYTKSGGLVPDARTRLDAQVTMLDDRMAAMEDRLAIRQRGLQAEYSAADALISQLNSQGSSLSSMVSGFTAF